MINLIPRCLPYIIYRYMQVYNTACGVRHASTHSFMLIDIMLASLSLQPVLLLLCFLIQIKRESSFCFSLKK